jgi:hypothetical protein
VSSLFAFAPFRGGLWDSNLFCLVDILSQTPSEILRSVKRNIVFQENCCLSAERSKGNGVDADSQRPLLLKSLRFFSSFWATYGRPKELCAFSRRLLVSVQAEDGFLLTASDRLTSRLTAVQVARFLRRPASASLPISSPNSPNPSPWENSPRRTSFPPKFIRLLLWGCERLRHSPPCRAVSICFSLVGTALLSFWAVPTTVHPYLGWALFYLGSVSLVSCVSSLNPWLPVTPLLAPWALWAVVLVVLWAPIYTAGAQKIVILCVLSALAAVVLVASAERIFATCHAAEQERKAELEPVVLKWGEAEKES